MAFRIETATRASQVHIVCQGHLDAGALAAIERGRAAVEAAGLSAVIRVCRGATADRTVVTCLAGYPVERLEVEPPFLRSWLEELRVVRARAVRSGSKERRGSGSDMR